MSRERVILSPIDISFHGKFYAEGYWTGWKGGRRDRWDVLICSRYRFDIGNWLAAFSKLRRQNLLEI